MKRLAENNKLLRIAVIVLWDLLVLNGTGVLIEIIGDNTYRYFYTDVRWYVLFLSIVAFVIGISCYLYKTKSIRFLNSNKALRCSLIALWSLAAATIFFGFFAFFSSLANPWD